MTVPDPSAPAPELRHDPAPAAVPAAPLALPLAREEVDRGAVARLDPGHLAAAWEREGTEVLWLQGGRAPVADGRLRFTTPSGPVPPQAAYLGRGTAADLGPGGRERAVVAVALEPPVVLPPDAAAALADAAWVGLRDAAAALSDADAGLFVAAVANANWHAAHRFCSFCGGATAVEAAGWVRRCEACGREHFPRTDPAVIVAVTDQDGRILLGRNAAWPAGRYSCLAGFVEPGESLEHAVVREVAEESGVTVADPRYRGSQPWPFPRSLMLGFTAQAPAGAEPVADGTEILSVRWFEREELAALAREGEITLPGAVSIARALIEDWYGGTLPDAQTLIT